MRHGILSKLFHTQTEQEKPYIPLNDTHWPHEWRRVEYKEYPRLPRVSLPEPALRGITLKEALEHRHSSRIFQPFNGPSEQQLATLLHYASGIRPNQNNTDASSEKAGSRYYPSGGARYPLETYIILHTRTGRIEPGAYHYNIQKHCLEELVDAKTLHSHAPAHGYLWARDASLTICMSGVWDRNTMKYEDFGYRMCLIEAGHQAQNLHLVAETLGLHYCPLAGFNIKTVNEILDLDTDEESVFYATVLGS